ncbi:MAG: hypothetical protein ACJ71W_12045 [Terriglobales bacterium]
MAEQNLIPIAQRPYGRIIQIAVNCTRNVRRQVFEMIKDGSAFQYPEYTSQDGTRKKMLHADRQAENEAIRYLSKHLGKKSIAVLGEETLWEHKELDLAREHIERSGRRVTREPGAEKKTVAIVDMVDGSDLLDRNFRNWCSALVFFNPDVPEILFALIHNDNGRIYGADSQGFFTLPRENSFELQPAHKPEVVRFVEAEKDEKNNKKTLPEEIDQISICYYGQKCSHFTSMPSGFFTWANTTPARSRLRLYNLAGNPMMARLANGENIHAVFEHIGQYAHDAVPGLFIALKAGAYVLDFAGNEISVETLTTHLLKPSSTSLQYVVGSTREVAEELVKALASTVVYYSCPVDPSHGGRTVPANSGPHSCPRCGAQLVIHERRAIHLAQSAAM